MNAVFQALKCLFSYLKGDLIIIFAHFSTYNISNIV